MTTPTQTTTPVPKATTKQTLITLFILIACVWGCNKILCSSDVDTSKYTKEQKDSVFGEEKSLDAFVMAQQFVKEKLKSPSTAEFPSGYKDFTKYNGDSTFHIAAYVDSQNSFGAMIRTKFTANVKFVGEEKWTCESVYLFQ